MFKKFIFVIAFLLLCAGGVQANCYSFGINAFEEGKYQEAFDIMKPIAEKGGIYVIAYVEHIQKKKLIENAEFNSPVEIPKRVRSVSDNWLKTSLAYMSLKKNLDAFLNASSKKVPTIVNSKYIHTLNALSIASSCS